MKNRAFTLVELLIVIIIIGVLAGAMMVAWSPIEDKTKATEIAENMKMAKSAILNYYTRNGEWPKIESNKNQIDFILSGYIDKKLGANYLMTRTTSESGKGSGLVKAGSIFIKLDNMDKTVSNGVKSQLAKLAEEYDLWDSTFYGTTDYPSRYYPGPGKKSSNTMHTPVFLAD